tara:strand:- start:4737 stop:7358 length:2622 start_codon:yes stop_codon:yes gene_type:complete
MKTISYLAVSALAIAATSYILISQQEETTIENEIMATTPPFQVDEEGKSLEPHDQWLTIRSYPDGTFDQAQYLERMDEVKMQAYAVGDSREVDLSIDWVQEGPGNIGGRIDVLTLSPTDHDIIYAGATNGGVFKTTDGGDNWDPIFDDQPYLSIGAITIDAEDEDIVYVGTGDRNFTGSSFLGNGIYKSEDSGDTWDNIGLEETGVVSKIIIDPTDSDRIFASTLGNPHVKNGQRGVYRSDDGGTTWSNKLFIADSAGISDMVMDPSNPDILYASGYNRMRNYFSSTVTGPQCRIYKTVNAGDTWTQLSGGLPIEDDCRIGLAISNDDPNTLFALYVDGDNLDVDDVYKTTDGGTSWNGLNVHGGDEDVPDNAMGGFGWYFGEIYLNPYDNDQLIIPGVEMYQSLDAGLDWNQNVPEWWTYEVHADKHAVAFLDENSYIIATDGGLYRTDDNGDSWADIENIPITQLYHIDVHPHEDGLYGAGAQDNGTMSGNASVFNDWERLNGGDGFRVAFLEEDAYAAYYETQNGGLRYADPGGETTNISPDDPDPDRTNWDMPYYINESAEELFVGTSRIQMMPDAPFGSYTYVSEDLTRIGMGEAFGAERYHTITEIDMFADVPDNLYVGTSDGLVWIGDRTDGGEFAWDWINITDDLPDHYITGLRCSPNIYNTSYVCMSGYKSDEEGSYLYRRNNGASGDWIDISGDLPNITVNDILVVPGFEDDEYLFAALDGGVYFTANGGEHWEYVGVGLPFVTVSELHMDAPNEKLIAGTYSRSIWSYDVSWIYEEDPPIDDTGIDSEQNTKIIAYPNPATDHVYFETVEPDLIEIYSQTGQLVLSEKVHHLNGYSKVNLAGVKTGIYFFRVGQSSGSIIIK